MTLQSAELTDSVRLRVLSVANSCFIVTVNVLVTAAAQRLNEFERYHTFRRAPSLLSNAPHLVSTTNTHGIAPSLLTHTDTHALLPHYAPPQLARDRVCGKAHCDSLSLPHC